MNATSSAASTHAYAQKFPEALYKTADKAERRRIQTELVSRHRHKLHLFVRSLVPAQHFDEGAQVGALGLLLALEKYDDAKSGPDRGKKDFFAFAKPYIRDEVRVWMDKGVRWRNTKVNKERKAAQAAKGTDGGVHHDSLDAASAAGAEFKAEAPTPDELASELEALKRLRAFVASLTVAEVRLLFVEREPGQRQADAHRALVRRARRAVRGSES